jgi:hypothetical protein
MKHKQLEELVLHSLEHELGCVRIYVTALSCVQSGVLKEEWEKYLAETRTHVGALEMLCNGMDIDATKETPGRRLVRHDREALVAEMKMALDAGEPAEAESVACECVVLAETKDRADWELLSKCPEHLTGRAAEALRSACDALDGQEDELHSHTKGWCRELWIRSLGLKAVLPPPEERRYVKSAMAAWGRARENGRPAVPPAPRPPL